MLAFSLFASIGVLLLELMRISGPDLGLFVALFDKPRTRVWGHDLLVLHLEAVYNKTVYIVMHIICGTPGVLAGLTVPTPL